MQAAEQSLRASAAAVAFLTRLPVGRARRASTAPTSRGAAPPSRSSAPPIGAAVGGTAAGLVHVLPALAAAGIALALGAALTGALHLDGLADTADALGERERERALAIMRDHAIGAYGAAALALDLLVKAAVLAGLAGTAARWSCGDARRGALARAAPVALAAALAGRARRRRGRGPSRQSRPGAVRRSPSCSQSQSRSLPAARTASCSP